jgi:hypothetical protein
MAMLPITRQKLESAPGQKFGTPFVAHPFFLLPTTVSTSGVPAVEFRHFSGVDRNSIGFLVFLEQKPMGVDSFADCAKTGEFCGTIALPHPVFDFQPSQRQIP